MIDGKKRTVVGLKLLIKGFRQFLKNQLTIAGLNTDVKDAINHNINLKIDSVIDMIDETIIENQKTEIYTITTIRGNGRQKRTPAYFFDFTKAEEYVIANVGDLWEGTYDFVIIEKVPPGLYAIDGREEYWYLYDQDRNEYRIIQKPDKFRRAVCWGIG